MVRSLVAALVASLLVCAGAEGATFHVDTTSDPGVPPGATDCPSPCSLRQAITASNNSPGVTDTIDFEIPGPGLHTLTLTFPLGGITDAVTIDGTTQDGWSTSSGPLIELSGAGQVGGTGLLIEEPTTVKGLVINRWPDGGITTLSFSGHDGSLAITGSYIGTNAAGTACAGNGSAAAGNAGIALTAPTPNTIGGTAAGERNVIACNSTNGVLVGPGVGSTTIQGSYVGILANGAVGSGQAIGVHAQASHVGVDGGALKNVISGNSQDGVMFEGASILGDSVTDSMVGTDPSGALARPNGRYGVYVNGSFQTLERNVIAANGSAGIRLDSAGHVDISDSNIGRGPGAGGALGAPGGVLGTPLGNGGGGIEIGDGSSLTGIRENVIASNSGDGIAVLGSAQGGQLAFNYFDANGGLGIDLDGDGVSPNDPDPDSGANEGQNYPTLTSVTTGGGNTTVNGAIDSRANAQYSITLYVNSSCDPSGFGEGQSATWPPAQTPDVPTNASGHGTFTFSFPGQAPRGSYITATANQRPGSGPGTSEFSRCLRVPGAPTATTGPASAVGQHGATLHGSANPMGLGTTARFQYGRTTSYGSSTPSRGLGSNFGQRQIAQPVAGLPSGTTIHYRLVVTNGKGTVRGADRTFKTRPDTTKPVVRLLLRRQRLRRALKRGYVARFDDNELGVATLDLFAKRRRVAHRRIRVRKVGRRKIVARFTRKAKRTLRRRRKVRLRVRLTVADRAGNKRVVRRRVTLKR